MNLWRDSPNAVRPCTASQEAVQDKMPPGSATTRHTIISGVLGVARPCASADSVPPRAWWDSRHNPPREPAVVILPRMRRKAKNRDVPLRDRQCLDAPDHIPPSRTWSDAPHLSSPLLSSTLDTI